MWKPTFRFSFVLEVLDPFLEHADGIVESVDCVGELRVKSERNAELKESKKCFKSNVQQSNFARLQLQTKIFQLYKLRKQIKVSQKTLAYHEIWRFTIYYGRVPKRPHQVNKNVSQVPIVKSTALTGFQLIHKQLPSLFQDASLLPGNGFQRSAWSLRAKASASSSNCPDVSILFPAVIYECSFYKLVCHWQSFDLNPEKH